MGFLSVGDRLWLMLEIHMVQISHYSSPLKPVPCTRSPLVLFKRYLCAPYVQPDLEMIQLANQSVVCVGILQVYLGQLGIRC